jgi:hypothetical protein
MRARVNRESRRGKWELLTLVMAYMKQIRREEDKLLFIIIEGTSFILRVGVK